MDFVDHTRVWLKSLQPEFRRDKEQIASLRHEYTVGRTLDHPNINRVRDFNIVRDIPFVVMDYFAAPNLKQSIRQHPKRVKSHLESIIKQAALGLGHLHEKGWIHRDIKPDNYLMDEECSVRLIDFAISQPLKSNPSWVACSAAKTKSWGHAATCPRNKFAASISTVKPTFIVSLA